MGEFERVVFGVVGDAHEAAVLALAAAARHRLEDLLHVAALQVLLVELLEGVHHLEDVGQLPVGQPLEDGVDLLLVVDAQAQGVQCLLVVVERLVETKPKTSHAAQPELNHRLVMRVYLCVEIIESFGVSH